MIFKIRIYFIILLILNILLNCSNKTDDNFFYKRTFFNYPYEKIDLDNKNIKYYEDGPNGYKEYFNGAYKLTNENNITILSVKDKSFIIFYLIDSLVLVDKSNGKIIVGTDYSIFGLGASDVPNLFLFSNIKADSFLTENNIKYSASNLEKDYFFLPWVEGKKGDGIGSKLSFDFF